MTVAIVVYKSSIPVVYQCLCISSFPFGRYLYPVISPAKGKNSYFLLDL